MIYNKSCHSATLWGRSFFRTSLHPSRMRCCEWKEDGTHHTLAEAVSLPHHHREKRVWKPVLSPVAKVTSASRF